MDKSTPKLRRYVQVPVSVSVCMFAHMCVCAHALFALWFVSGTSIFTVAYLHVELGYKTRQ